MADVVAATTKSTAPVANGTPSDAPTAPKKVTPKREVPMIACSPGKAEYEEIKTALATLMKNAGGISMDVPLGPFVLAHALSSIRSVGKK